RGLPAALRELADRSPIGVRVTATVPERLPPQVETTAYFVAAEALANVAKHSGATQAAVEVTVRNGRLTVVVTDDGVGAADPGGGSGLTGLADRVDAIGGTTLLSSPPGGPTVLKVEMPCA
ncbi:MAG: sensor histidine kinase, partial [Hamadaea sp.]|nr:sensor histidine kinase [Hamadaea sp.]